MRREFEKVDSPRSSRLASVPGREPVSSLSCNNSSPRFDKFPSSGQMVPVNIFDANFRLAVGKDQRGQGVRPCGVGSPGILCCTQYYLLNAVSSPSSTGNVPVMSFDRISNEPAKQELVLVRPPQVEGQAKQ